MEEIVAAHGKVDGLVTSAGFTENFEATAYPVDRMRRLWGSMSMGRICLVTAVARHLVSLSCGGFDGVCSWEEMLTDSRLGERPRGVWSSLVA